MDVDVTGIARMWADGTSFPNGRNVPVGSPLVLIVRPPGFDAQDYSVTLTSAPTPRVSRTC